MGKVISAETFKQVPEGLGKAIRDWWNPEMHDIYEHNSITQVIVDESLSKEEKEHYRRNTIPILTKAQVEDFLLDYTDCAIVNVDVILNDNITVVHLYKDIDDEHATKYYTFDERLETIDALWLTCIKVYQDKNSFSWGDFLKGKILIQFPNTECVEDFISRLDLDGRNSLLEPSYINNTYFSLNSCYSLSNLGYVYTNDITDRIKKDIKIVSWSKMLGVNE